MISRIFGSFMKGKEEEKDDDKKKQNDDIFGFGGKDGIQKTINDVIERRIRLPLQDTSDWRFGGGKKLLAVAIFRRFLFW